MRALRRHLVPLALLILATPVLAQNAEEEEAKVDEDLVIINVTKEMELSNFLDVISKSTGKPLLRKA